MYNYLIGDIHGNLSRLKELIAAVYKHITKEDTLIFLGDYIDRGELSFEVVELIISLKKIFNTVCLKGNHEQMFLDYLEGVKDENIYFYNGGRATINSYKKHMGEMKLPEHHRTFFSDLKNFYEGDDFIAVHAGLDPSENHVEAQKEYDLLWIRDKFYHSNKKWNKTIIFGHTPAMFLAKGHDIYEDKEKNIIGIDNGVIYNRPIVCLRWPDRKVIKNI